MAKTTRDSFKFMLRLPDDLRDKLKTTADTNGRSVTAEILHRLENSFGLDADGRIVLSLPNDLLGRMVDAWTEETGDRDNPYSVDFAGEIEKLLEREFPPPRFDDLVVGLKRALEKHPDGGKELAIAIRGFLNEVEGSKRQ